MTRLQRKQRRRWMVALAIAQAVAMILAVVITLNLL